MQTLKLTLKLGLVSLIAAALLAGAHLLTAEPIAKAATAELVAALRIALPEFDNSPAENVVTVIEAKDGKNNNIEVYRGTKNGTITGYAFRWQAANGFSGPIDFLIGVNNEGIISGISILKHSETPGLGAKITTKEFLKQFPTKSLANTKWQVTKDGGDVEVITGATITPRAIAAGVKEALEFFNNYSQKLATAKAGDKVGLVSPFDPDSVSKSPVRSRQPSSACFKLAAVRYALTESPLAEESNNCFDKQFGTFGQCVCNYNFRNKYHFEEDKQAIRSQIEIFLKANNFDGAIQGYCALPQNDLTKDDVLHIIKLINLNKHCLVSLSCVNNLLVECPIIAAHTDPNNPVEKKNGK